MRSVISDQAFINEVLESSTPVLVHFWAPWCGLCRMIEPALTQLLNEFGYPAKLVGINADENLKLASSYRITTLPTVLVFERGQVLHRLDSFQKRDELRSRLMAMLPLPVPVETISSHLQ
jgi:thioredoxin 1